LSLDNQEKEKTIQNSNKIITTLKDEYDILSKEYNDMEKYLIDLEVENKGHKTLLDSITKSHDIHKTLILKNENFKHKQIKKKKKIEDLKSELTKKDLEFKEIALELDDKNKILEDFQNKFDDLEKLLETKQVLLSTAEVLNGELKIKLKTIEKENREIIKKLNDEYINKKYDFEEIIKQSIEALKIFYAKFESNVTNGINENLRFDIKDNFNKENFPNFNTNNENQNYFNLENKEAKSISIIKNSKSAYNTVGYDNDDFDTKSNFSRHEKINRSLSPLGKKENLSRTNYNRNKYEKRSKSHISEKSKINLKNVNFLKNDIFDFKEFFDLYSKEQANIKRIKFEDIKKLSNDNIINISKNIFRNSSSNNNNKIMKIKNYNSNKVNSSLREDLERNIEVNFPLKLLVEQSLLNPINYKIKHNNILRGNLQAFNFYYNLLKSEFFSALLREHNIASFIKEKLNPILKEYLDDDNSNYNLKNMDERLKDLQKNFFENLSNNINDLKNMLNDETSAKNYLLQELKNSQAEKQKINNQLGEVESNFSNLNNIYNKNLENLVKKLYLYKDEKENLEKEIIILNEEISAIKTKHQKLLESFNDIKEKYSNSLGENEEMNKELLDLKKRIQQKIESKNIVRDFSHGVYVTTEENFSFKGNSKNENNTRQDLYSNYMNPFNEGNSDNYNQNSQYQLLSSANNNYNNIDNNSNKEIRLMKENLFLTQEIKKLCIEKENLKYHLSRLEKDIKSKNKVNQSEDLYVRRAAEVFYLPLISNNTFFHNKLNTNTFDYTNNNSNNLIFSSMDFNNLIHREDENNKRMNFFELENNKLNNQISQLLEKNKALEYKNNKLTQKLIRFSSRILSIHNNIRFTIEKSEEYVFKRELFEKNQEVNFKYNIPSINYYMNNREKEDLNTNKVNIKESEVDSNCKYKTSVNLNYGINNVNSNNLNTEEIKMCSTCKVQYQEVKGLRKVIKTQTYKEMKAFYMSFPQDLAKIANKFDKIQDNFNKTFACFDSEFDISNTNSNNFNSGTNALYNQNNNSSNLTILNKSIKVNQVKEILSTFSKMISVLGLSIKKYQNNISSQTNNLEKIFEFVYRIVFSTLVYNEKVKANLRETKSLNSFNSVKGKFGVSDENSAFDNNNNNFNKKNFLLKIEDYLNNLNRIEIALFLENEDSNEEICLFKILYKDKSTNEIIDAFKNNNHQILEEFLNLYYYSENRNGKESEKRNELLNMNKHGLDNTFFDTHKQSRNNNSEEYYNLNEDADKNKNYECKY